MKKRTLATIQNHAITLTIAVMVFMMASLTGCSSASETSLGEKEQSSTEGTVESKADKTEKTTEGAELSSEATPEPIEGDASQPTPEPVVYEGIDMESDLPAKEWIQTFIGVVDEPVVVICYDNTGRKEIVQEGSVINLDPVEDKIAIYYPDKSMTLDDNIPSKTNFVLEYGEVLDEFHVDLLMKRPKWPAQVTVTGGEEDWVINFTIVVE